MGLFGDVFDVFGFGSDQESTSSNAFDWQTAEYGKLKKDFLSQGILKGLTKKAGQFAGQDWMGLGKTIGQRSADQSNMALMNALAGRGGGNLASALEMGAQTRSNAALGGMQTGAQLDQASMNQLNQILQTKWAALTALFGKQAMTSAAMIGAGANMYGTDIGAQSKAFGDILGSSAQVISSQ